MTSTSAASDSFLERLNAVEEELDCSPAYSYNQVTLSVHLSVHLPLYLSGSLTGCLSVFLSICLSLSVWTEKLMMVVLMKAPAVWRIERAPSFVW